MSSWVTPAARKRSSSPALSVSKGRTITAGPRTSSAPASRAAEPEPQPAGRREERDGEQAGQDADARRPRPAIPAPSASSAAGAAPVAPATSHLRLRVRWHRRAPPPSALVPFEMRDVVALRDGDAHGVPGAGIDVVAVKVAPQAPGFETDDRIGLRVERLVAAEDGKPERIPFQPVGTSCERLFHQVPQKHPPPRARLECRTVQDTFQLRADVGRRRTS